MSRRCLRYEIPDLADGRLGPMATEQAHAHVAWCAKCRAAVIAQREASARLRSMQDATPQPDFLRRLSAIPAEAAAMVHPALPVQNSSSVVSLADHGRSGSHRSTAVKTAGVTVISIAGLVGVAALVGVSESQVAVSVPSTQQSIAPMFRTLSDVQRPAFQPPSPASVTFVNIGYQPPAPHRSHHLVP